MRSPISGLVVFTGLVSVMWLALGRPKLGRRGDNEGKRSVRRLRSLASGGVALGVIASLLKDAIVIGVAAAAVFALFFLVLRRLARCRPRRRTACVRSQISACQREKF
jgi:heme A synthase